MARGGVRPGSGRKKGIATIKAEEARAFVVRAIVEELGPIMKAQIEAAKGLYYEETTDDGTKKTIYKQKPDITAGKNLLDQTIGKAKETLELGGKDDGPIQLDVRIQSTIDKIYGDTGQASD